MSVAEHGPETELQSVPEHGICVRCGNGGAPNLLWHCNACVIVLEPLPPGGILLKLPEIPCPYCGLPTSNAVCGRCAVAKLYLDKPDSTGERYARSVEHFKAAQSTLARRIQLGHTVLDQRGPDWPEREAAEELLATLVMAYTKTGKLLAKHGLAVT